MAAVGPLNFPDTPSFGDPTFSWPWYSIVGYPIRSEQHPEPDYQSTPLLFDKFVKPGLNKLREDEEIIIILTAILKEL